ncbi:putative RND efflux membrane fusion protein [Chitinispirillum alkaliphilum]|nr:putative RND efflux membrane fusion protein [Chitinispirillum alkaliphilum]
MGTKKIICIAVAIIGCGGETTTPNLTIENMQAKQGIPVEVQMPKVQTLQSVHSAGGTVEGIRQTYLSTAAPGTVKNIPVSIGNTVRRGGLLASMEFDEGAPLGVAQSAYVYASESLNRVEQLYLEGAVSRGEVEKVRAQYQRAKHQKGQASVAQFIRAPFAGTVMDILRSEGTKVDAKTPLVLLSDLSEVKIDLRVHNRAVKNYQKGQSAYIIKDNGDSLAGTIEHVSLSAHPLTHGFTVTVRFPNCEQLLLPGMYRQVHTVTERRSEAVSVPVESLFTEDGKWYLYTVSDGHAVKKMVEPGILDNGYREISSGLGYDEKVIVRGISQIADGSKIKVVNR